MTFKKYELDVFHEGPGPVHICVFIKRRPLNSFQISFHIFRIISLIVTTSNQSRFETGIIYFSYFRIYFSSRHVTMPYASWDASILEIFAGLLVRMTSINVCVVVVILVGFSTIC